VPTNPSNKVSKCFTLKPENIRLLRENQGIATTSAYLDFLIEKSLAKKQSGGKQ